MLSQTRFYLIFVTVFTPIWYLCEAADSHHKIIFPDDPYMSKLRNGSAPMSRDNLDDPCVPYDPPPPNFSRSGRRISAAKCYEYIWQMKNRSKKFLREVLCIAEQERRKNGGLYEPVKQIIGGTVTSRGEFPNMGAIGWKAVVGTWVFMCGSSLISPKFVLTAAHCSSASIRDTTLADIVPKIVRLGQRSIMDADYVKKNAHDAQIIRIINHPKYNPPKKYFDIALMELGSEVKFSSELQPACLWSGGDVTKYGKKADIAGWGVVKSGSSDMSSELLSAKVDLINHDSCAKLLQPYCSRNWCGLQGHQMCAGKLAGGVDSCQGDSGGPLQVKIPLPNIGQGSMHYILGVTSFGIGCGLPNLPGVYTKVSSFVDWIEQNVWK